MARKQSRAAAKAADIAQRILGIETLEEQRSDSLDFHDLSVVSIEKALVAAFEAGKASAK